MKAIRQISPLARHALRGAAILLTSAALAAPVPIPPADPNALNSQSTLMKQGDAHEARLKTTEALACFLEVEKAEPKNPAVLVRIARQYRHLMSDQSSGAAKLKLGYVALDYGNRAAAIAPEDSDAVLSPAITYGRMVKFLPKKDQVAVSKVVKTQAEKAVMLQPRNDLAWHVLGRWHRVASDVGGVKRALAGMLYDKLPPASNAEAMRCLENAVKLNPNRLMHHVELGKAYAQAGRKDDARRHLKKGIDMAIREKDDAEVKQSGREVLATLK